MGYPQILLLQVGSELPKNPKDVELQLSKVGLKPIRVTSPACNRPLSVLSCNVVRCSKRNWHRQDQQAGEKTREEAVSEAEFDSTNLEVLNGSRVLKP